MKQIIKNCFLVLWTILLIWLIWPIINEYIAMHPYYNQFLAGDAKWQNLSILLLWLTTALLPVLYLSQSKKPAFWPFILLLWWWLWLFFTAYIGIKSDLYGAAVFKSLINSSFIFALGVTFIVQLIVFGHRLNKRFLRITFSWTIMTFLLSLAMWLVGFLVVQYLLLLLNIAFPIINRALWGWWIYLIWKYQEWLSWLWEWLTASLFHHEHNTGWVRNTPVLPLIASIVVLIFAWFLYWAKLSTWWALMIAIVWVLWLVRSIKERYSNKYNHTLQNQLFSLQWLADIAFFIILLLVVRYFYNGVVLSFIPYPTAWDANHAYMFLPKMYALHNWYYRNELSMRGFGGLWLPYITFWFSLFSFSHWFLGISADTIAIEMNFLSWLFVILFGVWLIWMVISVLRNVYNDEDQENNAVFSRLLVLLGALFILLRNTSGMWAFLVFIDNKTDMWVLTMVIVALLSWFAFLRTYLELKKQEKEHTSDIAHWLMLSGSFFAIAVLAKPTAMFDVLNFFLLLRWLWFGIFGVLAFPLLIIGLLSLLKMRWIQDYFTPVIWQWLSLVWWVWFGLEVVRQWYKKLMHYGTYLLIWWWCFLWVLVGMKLLFYVPDTLFYGNDNKWVKEWINILLLAQDKKQDSWVLLAQAANWLPPSATCSLWSEWLTQASDLYKELKPIIWNGYDEDVWRYIGYGWKWNAGDRARWVAPFVNSWWAKWFEPWCYSFSPFFIDSHDAVTLCRTEEDWKSFDRTRLESVKQQVRQWWVAFGLLDQLANASWTSNVNELKVTYREQMLALDWIMQGESMKIVAQTTQDGSVVKEIYLPYKYLNFFNISFNRSLQNLSSYYTDIGIVWLILIFTTVLWLLYAFVTYDRFLISLHVVTLFGWILWLFLWWGILWYGIWVIIWTILCLISLVYALSRRVESSFHVVLVWLFVAALTLTGIWQLSYNLLRISTQWWWWAFMRYKSSNWIDQRVVITPQGQIMQDNKITWSFGYDNVFALQFPHYNKFLNLVNNRKEDEWAFIAWTYARYFVNNQAKIVNDWFLIELWHWFSDNNVCRSYLRLQDKWLKYFAIDPNIWTVVQWEGNKWLFERFYARLNPTDGTIEQHGTITMLAALVQKWYIRYVSSNNLGAKYAMILPDAAFGGVNSDALIVTRARMMIARFFQDQQLISMIINIADQRIKDWSFFWDIADIIWLTVSEQTIQKVMKGEQLNPAELTEDEKKVLIQFYGLRQQAAAADKAQYQQSLQNFVMQSLGAWNQVIVFELVE